MFGLMLLRMIEAIDVSAFHSLRYLNVGNHFSTNHIHGKKLKEKERKWSSMQAFGGSYAFKSGSF